MPSEAPSLLSTLRSDRLAPPRTVGRGRRLEWAGLVDGALRQAWSAALGVAAAGERGLAARLDAGAALVAVGSQARRDAGPCADLDLLLVHDPDLLHPAQVDALARALWYPVWDAGLALDHAVRSVVECRRIASADLPAAVGLLALRHVAGAPGLAARAGAAVLEDWRGAARRRLPEVLAGLAARAERFGEVAFRVEPDLKQARGGLRDLTLVDALAATWLTDRPHGPELDAAAETLLDTRDAVQLVTGRAGTVLLRPDVPDVAALLGHADAEALRIALAGAGRRVAYALDVTVRRARAALRPRAGRGPMLVRGRRAGPRLRALADGLVEHDGEVVLGAGTRVRADPGIALRAAAVAAREGLPLSPVTARALAEAPVPSTPWPTASRADLLTLLRSGPALPVLWEALDQAGVIARLIPEWAAVRNRPQVSPVHVHTVDRHLVEAVALVPPHALDRAGTDTVLWGALLHDIGKIPGALDHAEAGAPIAAAVLERIGVPPAQAADVVTLVRRHLVLAETATTRDPADPASVAIVLDAVGHRADLLRALRVLTEADARAAGPAAWTPWRARLVDSLTAAAATRLR